MVEQSINIFYYRTLTALTSNTIYIVHQIGKFVIQESTSDELLILYGNMDKLPAKATWLTSSNTEEALNCREEFKSQVYSSAILFLQAYTGCDCNAVLSVKEI